MIQLRSLIDAGELKLGSRGLEKRSFDAAQAKYRAYFGGIDEKSAYHCFTQNMWYLGNKVAAGIDRLPLRRLVDFQLAFADAFRGILDYPQQQETVMRNLAVQCLGKV